MDPCGTLPLRSSRVLAAAVVALCALLGAVAVSGATPSIRFAGQTSQRRSISFTLGGGAITALQYHIVDRCPGGRLLFVHDSGFPSLPVKNSKFGGKFVAKPPQEATAIVSGRISGRTVRGTLTDRTRNKKTHKFCAGNASFKLTHPRK